MVKKIFSVSGCLCLINLAGFPAAAQKLVVGLYDFAPHVIADGSIRPNSQPRGAVIDLFQKKFHSRIAGLEIEYRLRPFARLMEELAAGKIDLAVCLAKTPERDQKFRYVDEPMTMAVPAVILKKSEAPVEIKSMKQLSGKTLGHLKGSITPDYLAENSIQISYLSGEQYHIRNLEKLKINRIDGVFIPTYSNGLYELETFGSKNQFSILKLPVEATGLYFVFRKDIPKEIFDTFNKDAKKIPVVYEEYLRKYYP